MSRRTYWEDKEEIIEVIEDYKECRWKTNGKCYNNRVGYKRLGKVCKEICTLFLEEKEGEEDGSKGKGV